MGKIRKGLILLLTCLCIGLAALLPRLVGWIQDRRVMNRVAYNQSAQVRLEIQEDMPLMGKLALLCRMDGVIQVPEALAEMTYEEAEQAAMDALQPYIEAGLIPEFTVWHIEAQPILIRTAETADLTGLIWAVTVLSDEEGILNVSLDIDDATGKLLRLTFNYEYWEQPDLSGSLSRLAEVYFGGLAMEEYGQFATDDLENRYIGDDTVGRRYRFEDATYGYVNLDLYVHCYGFYVATPYV